MRVYLFLLWLADGVRERDREAERLLGAEPDRDLDLERLEKRKHLHATLLKDKAGIMLRCI